MLRNEVREKLLAGRPVLGAMLGLGSPNVAELMAMAGYDFLIIETEHNGLDSAEVEHMLMAIGQEAVPVVRVPSADPVFIQRALDIGGMGILVPMVRTAGEAAAIVGATRYPPQGTRGFGPLRASRYTFDYEEYYAGANDNILVALIVETREALENLDEIAAVSGVDALFFGLFDLCLSLGLNPMQQPFPELEEAMEAAAETGRKRGVAIGVGVPSPEELRRRNDMGFRFHVYGTDYMMLGAAAKAGVEAFRSLEG